MAIAGIAAALWFRQSWAWWIVVVFHTFLALGISLVFIGASAITLFDFCLLPREQGRALTANQLKGDAGLGVGTLVALVLIVCLFVRASRKWSSNDEEVRQED